MRLSREIRCYAPAGREGRSLGPPPNTWAGTGPGPPAGPFWVVRAVVEGPIDDRTGYLCNLKELDAFLRGPVLGLLAGGGKGSSDDISGKAAGPSPAELGARLLECLRLGFDDCPPAVQMVRLELALSPFTRISVQRGDDMVQLTQSFEFAAAHRLYCRDWDDAENLRVFGKCSNPHGHGHNYVVEVTVTARPERGLTDLGEVDRVVRQRVIDPLDHKNLNTECPEFAGLNPTVENIARVIWARLHGQFAGSVLVRVRVFETAKTCAEFTGE